MCIKKLNVNPSKRITEDSFVRAVTIALNISYKEAYRAIADFALNASLSMTDARTIKGFLKAFGYCEQKLKNNCNIATFVDNNARAQKVYIIRVGRNGVTVVKNRVVYDNYDVSKKMIRSYWIIN